MKTWTNVKKNLAIKMWNLHFVCYLYQVVCKKVENWGIYETLYFMIFFFKMWIFSFCYILHQNGSYWPKMSRCVLKSDIFKNFAKKIRKFWPNFLKRSFSSQNFPFTRVNIFKMRLWSENKKPPWDFFKKWDNFIDIYWLFHQKLGESGGTWFFYQDILANFYHVCGEKKCE